MLEFIGVSKFNLKGINIKIDKGEFVVIRGGGGTGKTTLLKLAYGELLPDEGEIKIFDQPIVGNRHACSLQRSKVGFIPQENKLLEDKSVLTNLAFPLKLLGKYDKRAVLSILDKLGLCEYNNLKACELSCSHRQLLQIALALSKSPLLLLADEPLQNLTPELKDKVLSIFKDMHTTGTTILFATAPHIAGYTYFTRELCISDGGIVGIE